MWYTSFKLTDKDELPVIVEISKENKQYKFCIINGSERIILDDLQYSSDSIFIKFPAFASELRGKIHSKTHISGNWYNHAKKGNYYLPFWSKYDHSTKYPIETPIIDVSGRWEVTFDYNIEPEKAVGLFSSEKKTKEGNEIGNRITGTFLTETGDYRFLEGATIQDSLYLSTFDGSHAFLFKAQLRSDTLWGEFLSGKHYRTNWYAIRNPKFELRHPDSLTIADKSIPLAFSLPNVDGELYNYPNDASKGKVTLLQIMGTWCPNCLDESMYLKSLSEKYGLDLNIIAITFETQKGLEAKMKKVNSYRVNLGLNYTFLIGGDACKSCASDVFPTLNHIMSFPTLIFIDKAGEIRKVHTGFNGPGTGKYYEQFIQSTDDFIDQLINE
ncbi:MAG: TlpA disulfide reductase family protein [Crocinitomicaceae bacterium]